MSFIKNHIAFFTKVQIGIFASLPLYLEISQYLFLMIQIFQNIKYQSEMGCYLF